MRVLFFIQIEGLLGIYCINVEYILYYIISYLFIILFVIKQRNNKAIKYVPSKDKVQNETGKTKVVTLELTLKIFITFIVIPGYADQFENFLIENIETHLN